MDTNTLREHLNELRNELDSLPVAEREKTAQLIADIEQEIEQHQFEDGTGAFIENMENHIAAFESEHPTLTAIVNNILVTLSSMGL